MAGTLEKIAPPETGDILAQLMKVMQGYDPKTTTTTSGNPQTQALLEQLAASLTGTANSGDFSKDAAFSDTDALVQQLMKTFQENALPSIYQQQSNTGGYNSTTGKLLANDAMARAIAQASAAKVDNAAKYAAIQNQQASTAIQAASAAQKGTTTQVIQQKPSIATTAIGLGSLAAKALPLIIPRTEDAAAKGLPGLTNPKIGKLDQSTLDDEDMGAQLRSFSDISGGNDVTFSGTGNALTGGGVSTIGESTTPGVESFGFRGINPAAIQTTPIDVADALATLGGGAAETAIPGLTNTAADAVSNADDLELGNAAKDLSVGTAGGLDASDAINTDITSSVADVIGPATSTGIDAAGGVIGDLSGYGASEFASDIGSSALADVGTDTALSFSFPYYTAFKAAGDILGINEINDITAGVSNVVGTLADGVGDVLGGVGDAVSSAFDSVICSELYRQGLISRQERLKSYVVFRNTLSDESIEGYKWWAKKLVKKMQKSRRWTMFGFWIFDSWLGQVSKRDPSLVGKILHYIIRPPSWCIGMILLKNKRSIGCSLDGMPNG